MSYAQAVKLMNDSVDKGAAALTAIDLAMGWGQNDLSYQAKIGEAIVLSLLSIRDAIESQAEMELNR